MLSGRYTALSGALFKHRESFIIKKLVRILECDQLSGIFIVFCDIAFLRSLLYLQIFWLNSHAISFMEYSCYLLFLCYFFFNLCLWWIFCCLFLPNPRLAENIVKVLVACIVDTLITTISFSSDGSPAFICATNHHIVDQRWNREIGKRSFIINILSDQTTEHPIHNCSIPAWHCGKDG